jgi:hypothetical protein
MDKAAKREAKRLKDRFKPRGNPKFLHLLMQEEKKRNDRIRR